MRAIAVPADASLRVTLGPLPAQGHPFSLHATDLHAAAVALLTALSTGAATAAALTACGGAGPGALAREASLAAALAALLAAGHVIRTGVWYTLAESPPAPCGSAAPSAGCGGALACAVAPPLRSLTLLKRRAVKRRAPRALPPPPPPRKRKAVSDDEGDATWDAKKEEAPKKGKKRVSFRLEVQE